MFRIFSSFPGVGPNALFRVHPYDLQALLEFAWDHRAKDPFELGHPRNRSDLPGLGSTWLGASAFGTAPTDPVTKLIRTGLLVQADRGKGVVWDHLIYAYMIANTRVVPIFRRVVLEFLQGEKLGAPSTQNAPGLNSDTQRWLRSTEELFFRPGAPFFVSSLTGALRSDPEEVARASFMRLFGMDLNHGTDDNKPFPYNKAEASNTLFVATLEELLREVWLGIENVKNQSGANPTDDAKIFDLVTKLRDMLMTRREAGNLSREEFALVSMMSWFHLTLESDTPIVQDLRAQGASPEQRLFAAAQRVGLPAHGLSRSYMSIAEPLSSILTAIESNVFQSAADVPILYNLALSEVAVRMATIIGDYSTLSGRSMKQRAVALT